MSKEIVVVLKNGQTVKGDTYRYNHFTKYFELLNHTTLVARFPPEEIKEIKTGEISANSMDSPIYPRTKEPSDATSKAANLKTVRRQ
jgi:hypothetical protein